MCGFGVVEDEVPEIVVGALSLGNLIVWLWFSGVNDIGELHCVLNEEDWNVVANNVPVAFLGVEFDGETTNISHRVGAAPASENC